MQRRGVCSYHRTMDLLDMLENSAGQDLTDNIMHYLSGLQHEYWMHLVSKRMHALMPSKSVAVNFDMRVRGGNPGARAQKLQDLDDKLRTISNVRSYCVHIQNMASAQDANDVLSNFLNINTPSPRPLGALFLYMPEVDTPSHANTLLSVFLSPHTPQSNLGLTGLALSFRESTERRAPEFVHRLTTLQHLLLKDAHIGQISEELKDLVHLESLVIRSRWSTMVDEEQHVRDFPIFLSILTRLEELGMSNFFEFTEEVVGKTVDLQQLTALTKLDLSSNYLQEVARW